MKNIFTLLYAYIIKKILFRITFIILITFTIQASAQSIIVTSPNGGETLRNGTEHNITWTHLGTIDSVNIEISTDGGLSFTSLEDTISNTNSYLWTVPNLDEADVRIKISDAAEPDTNDISDANFRIISPNITSSPVKILPIGDSITWGSDATPGLHTGDLASYRFKLWDLFRLNNYNIDFIGSEYSGYNIFPDYQNGGFGGTLILDIKSILETGINIKFNPDDTITYPQKYLYVYTPDIVLLHIGTNVNEPISTPTERENTATAETNRISQVLDDIFNMTYNPNANNTWVILALVLNSDDSIVPNNSAYYQVLNDHIETMANNRINNGDRILIVDMYNIPDFSYTIGGDFSDEIHPNSSGYTKMGQVWYNALELILPAGTTAAPIFSQTNIDTIAYINIPFNYQAIASGVGAPIYSITSGPGTINQYTGKMNWIPNTVGDVSITITASNGTNPDATQNLTIHVLPQPNIPAELISYWRFDENKQSGPFTDAYNLNNGYSESSLSNTTGQVNSAYTFDGSDKINVFDQPEFDFQDSSFTVEAWVKRFGNGAVIGKYGRTIDENYWWLGINGSNQPTFFVSFKLGSGDTRTNKEVVSSAIPIDTWTHIVGIKNELTNIKIYVNGILQGTTATGSGLTDNFDSQRPLNIGHWYNSKIFTGAIDEVAIYDDVLDDATILDHYNRGYLYNKGYFDDFVIAKVKIFLEGPYDTSSNEMFTTLNSPPPNDYIPLTSPYSESEYVVENIPADIVDWVELELRESDGTTIVTKKSAFLRKDGMVVGDNGTDDYIIIDAPAGDYHIVVRHRNHLAVMSSGTISLNQNAPGSVYDFITGTGSQFYPGSGIGAKELETGVWGMFAGDANSEGSIDAIDKNDFWRIQNGTIWFYSKYSDFNLDGNLDAVDKNGFWRPNHGKSTQVPQ